MKKQYAQPSIEIAEMGNDEHLLQDSVKGPEGMGGGSNPTEDIEGAIEGSGT